MASSAVLGVLGLNQTEQDFYERLIGCPPMTVGQLDELADECGYTGQAGRVLSRLVQLGLVAAVPSDPERWSATPPNTALQMLLSARDRALAEARGQVADLVSRFVRTEINHDHAAMVEVIRGREKHIRRFSELQRGARHQVRACDGPPYPANDAVQLNTTEVDQLRAGLQVRVIYDRRALDIPGRLADLEAGIAAGEQARVADIPLKMTLFDDTAAVLPLSQPPDVETRLVVHHPVLLDALSALFEIHWQHALPLHVSGGRAELDGSGTTPSPMDRHLLVLLVAGQTDQEIAAQLGVSDRTVRARVRAMMARLDATTRFQAGYQAVVRGWLTTGSQDSPDAVPTTTAPADAARLR
ncbi:LuxR C-terminal-related transcriptional regulator [Micromonospora sp. DR5-3]|uniref:helix-turn-helix transcriptional regulator n=1 Tax=unclassified Micromonospora TaxID=2617518 RepID=UPI0011D98995|nr:MULTISPECIES: helix-turn-helix transcriptional regulator [unclassified Micromonospora]MCW3813471.1 LuxR C-terminal-related transcriptional regulator [Micromonospora sp. DR5-3]TYC24861.1 transcriptional regulator TrmB [Micromonospora sp. MP36]